MLKLFEKVGRITGRTGFCNLWYSYSVEFNILLNKKIDRIRISTWVIHILNRKSPLSGIAFGQEPNPTIIRVDYEVKGYLRSWNKRPNK